LQSRPLLSAEAAAAAVVVVEVEVDEAAAECPAVAAVVAGECLAAVVAACREAAA